MPAETACPAMGSKNLQALVGQPFSCRGLFNKRLSLGYL